MKTKKIACPCCGVDLECPLQGGPKTIICPICKMRVEDPDGIEAPTIQAYPLEPRPRGRPAPAVIRKIQGKPGRKRSSSVLKVLYVFWLLLCMVGNALTSFTLGFSIMYHRLPFYHPNGLVAGLLLISIPCIFGIFLRRKWGVYGFCAGNLLSALLLFPKQIRRGRRGWFSARVWRDRLHHSATGGRKSPSRSHIPGKVQARRILAFLDQLRGLLA